MPRGGLPNGSLAHLSQDEWSADCDDDCPACGARHMSPLTSDDLTVVITPAEEGGFVLLRSSDTAEDRPDYQVLGHFPTREAAEASSMERLP